MRKGLAIAHRLYFKCPTLAQIKSLEYRLPAIKITWPLARGVTSKNPPISTVKMEEDGVFFLLSKCHLILTAL